MLPMKIILREYLKNDYVVEDFGDINHIPKSQYHNIRSLVDKDLNNNFKELYDEEDELKGLNPKLRMLRERTIRANKALQEMNSDTEELDDDSDSESENQYSKSIDSIISDEISEDLQNIQSNLHNMGNMLNKDSMLDQPQPTTIINPIKPTTIINPIKQNYTIDEIKAINKPVKDAREDTELQELLKHDSILSRPPVIKTGRNHKMEQFNEMVRQQEEKNKNLKKESESKSYTGF
jgi:deoxyribodipyrimidine photolyase